MTLPVTQTRSAPINLIHPGLVWAIIGRQVIEHPETAFTTEDTKDTEEKQIDVPSALDESMCLPRPIISRRIFLSRVLALFLAFLRVLRVLRGERVLLLAFHSIPTEKPDGP